MAMPPVVQGYAGQAQKKGWLVYYMNQALLPSIGNATLARTLDDGLCGGFAALWVALQYAGQDLPFDRSRLEYRALDFRAVRAQAAMKEANAKARAANTYGLYTAWDVLARQFHMTTSPGLRDYCWGPPTWENWLKVVGRAYGCYGVTLVGNGGASHAIAIHHAHDNRFHLFDANSGHYVAKYKEGFAKFFEWYLWMNDYGREYGHYQTIVGIRPPS